MALSTEEVLAGLAELINDETGIATDTVELDKSFTDDLDIDSISMMTIVVNAEEKFDVKIPDEEVKNLKTVGDAVSFIVNAQALAPIAAGGRHHACRHRARPVTTRLAPTHGDVDDDQEDRRHRHRRVLAARRHRAGELDRPARRRVGRQHPRARVGRASTSCPSPSPPRPWFAPTTSSNASRPSASTPPASSP